MLHLIKSSPFSSNALEQCLTYLNRGDQLLLLQDGVIAALEQQPWLDKMLLVEVTLFALQEDVEARGFSNNISSEFTLIDMHGFVALTEQNETIMSW